MLALVALVVQGGCRHATPTPRTDMVVRGGDSVRTTVVAPGVRHERHWLAAGPWVVQVVRVDLTRCECHLAAMHAFDGVRGRETVSAMTQRFAARGQTVLAGINADFFDLRTGDVENTQVVAGEWTKGNGISESPHHVFPTVHVQVAQRPDGRVDIGRFVMRGWVRVRGDSLALSAINPQRRGTQGVVLYSWRFGARTPVSRATGDSGTVQVDPDGGAATPERLAAQARRDSVRLAADTIERLVAEVALVPVDGGAAIRSGRRRYRVVSVGSDPRGGLEIPRNGLVLSVRRDDVASMRTARLSQGAEAEVEVLLGEAGAGRGVRGAAGAGTGGAASAATGWPVETVVGGWGQLLVAGEDRSARVDSLEGTFPRFSAARHPRTAVGLARGGRELVLVGVDGRGSNGSVGMSLVELGSLLRSLGATEGGNLDGGGSTTVWVRGAGVVNRPSDPTGERPVGNGLFVVRR